MTTGEGPQPEAQWTPAYRGTDRTQPIPPCTFTPDDLIRLYRTLQGKNSELLEEIVRHFQPTAELTTNQYRENTRPLLQVAVSAAGTGGEQVVTFDESGLEEANLPEKLNSIMLDSSVKYSLAMGSMTPNAPNRFVVSFDFRRPPLFDLTDQSGTPTPNTSHFQITASNSTWAAGVQNEIIKWLDTKRVGRGWLHMGNTYDVLLFTIAMWMALWGAWRIYGAWIQGTVLERSGIGSVLVIYVFLVLLAISRLLFNAARWVWPYLELQRSGRTFGKGFRIVVGGAFGAMFITFVIDVFGFIFSGRR